MVSENQWLIADMQRGSTKCQKQSSGRPYTGHGQSFATLGSRHLLHLYKWRNGAMVEWSSPPYAQIFQKREEQEGNLEPVGKWSRGSSDAESRPPSQSGSKVLVTVQCSSDLSEVRKETKPTTTTKTHLWLQREANFSQTQDGDKLFRLNKPIRESLVRD